MNLAMTSCLRLRSYAKINWTLEVMDRRPDGYHELRTIYQSVSLYDTIRLRASPGKIEVGCDDARVPGDESNLAYRAANSLREVVGSRAGALIEIQKRIPVGGGLGGGSSNAAVTLLGLSALWKLEISNEALSEMAAKLGSDVPFFLVGGTALGTGRGEIVSPIEQADCPFILLVNPGFSVSTADAYGKLSRLTRRASTSIMPFALMAANGVRGLPHQARNDLEQAVLPAHPEIAEVKRRLLGMGARTTLMSGSGATVFGVFDNCETLSKALEDVRAIGYRADQVRTISRLEYWDSIFE